MLLTWNTTTFCRVSQRRVSRELFLFLYNKPSVLNAHFSTSEDMCCFLSFQQWHSKKSGENWWVALRRNSRLMPQAQPSGVEWPLSARVWASAWHTLVPLPTKQRISEKGCFSPWWFWEKFKNIKQIPSKSLEKKKQKWQKLFGDLEFWIGFKSHNSDLFLPFYA